MNKLLSTYLSIVPKNFNFFRNYAPFPVAQWDQWKKRWRLIAVLIWITESFYLAIILIKSDGENMLWRWRSSSINSSAGICRGSSSGVCRSNFRGSWLWKRVFGFRSKDGTTSTRAILQKTFFWREVLFFTFSEFKWEGEVLGIWPGRLAYGILVYDNFVDIT